MRYFSTIVLVAFISNAAGAPSLTDGAATSDPLLGLWGNETDFGRPVHGELTIDGRDGEWRAVIDGFDLPAQRVGNALTFKLPGGQGQFRGTLGNGEKTLVGFWIQPANVTHNQAYATPLRFVSAQKQVWQARVEPLADRMSQYLMIRRDDDGSISAFFRSPEFNFGGGRIYKVTFDENKLTLTNVKRQRDQMRGTFDPQSDRLTIAYEGVATYEFTRRGVNDAQGFYPLTPAADNSRYRVPIRQNDGWTPATARDVGMNAAPLEKLLTHLDNAVPDSGSAPYIQGLLIARHGKLILERYYHGFARDRVHDLRSSGKTFASLLIGLARKRGAGLDTQETLYILLPEYRAQLDSEPRKRQISVAHLLSMTSGFSCDDNDDDSPGNEDKMQQQNAEPDWYRYTLALPMASDPGGEQALYCSAGINLLGAIVAKTTGTWIPAFFDEQVARPMNFGRYYWNLQPDGSGYLAGGAHLLPRDLLKLAQLYLSGGRWNGRPIIDQAWIDESTRQHSHFEPGHGYGYAWHLRQLTVGGRSYREYEAEGNGGQLAMVIPELDLAVLITAGNYNNFSTWSKFQDLLVQYVIPAVIK